MNECRCRGSGFLLHETARGRIELACTCQTRVARHALAAARPAADTSGVPRRYRAASVDHPAIQGLRDHARKRVLAFRKDIGPRIEAGRGLWLYGPATINKSWPAALLALAARDAGCLVSFASTTRVITELKEPRPYEEPETVSPLATIAFPDLLVLTDLDDGREDDWAVARLAVELRRRAGRAHRAMVVTTNVAPEELAASWGWPLLYALKDVCGTPLNVDPAYVPPPPDPVAVRRARSARKRRAEGGTPVGGRPPGAL